MKNNSSFPFHIILVLIVPCLGFGICLDKLCEGSDNAFGLVLGMLFFGFIMCMIILPLLKAGRTLAPCEPETNPVKPGISE